MLTGLPHPTQLVLRPWARWLGRAQTPAEVLWARTADDVRLAVHRVRAAQPGGDTHAPAVVLLHGLGSNRFAFMLPERSLAQWLADRGFDVYVPELRGAGRSVPRHWRYDLEDYLKWDLPAILRCVQSASGQQQVQWVGHSMGGILMMCHAIRTRGEGLQSGCAIGSALDYRPGKSGFLPLYRAREYVTWLPLLPFGPLSHLLAPALARLDTPVERFNFWPTNVEPGVVRSVYANAFGWIPSSLLRSMSSLFEEGGLCSRDGAVRYLERLGQLELPVALFAASADVQCSLLAVEQTAQAAGEGRITLERFGRAFGHADDYGHFDLIVGKRAEQEVWPRLLGWLSAHAGARRPSGAVTSAST